MSLCYLCKEPVTYRWRVNDDKGAADFLNFPRLGMHVLLSTTTSEVRATSPTFTSKGIKYSLKLEVNIKNRVIMYDLHMQLKGMPDWLPEGEFSKRHIIQVHIVSKYGERILQCYQKKIDGFRPDGRFINVAPGVREADFQNVTIECCISLLSIQPLPSMQLGQDLCKLFKASKFSDVTLVAEGKEIPAHKNILAARSSVFEAMFAEDIIGKKSSRIEIDDKEDVLTELLRFIYTDGVNKEMAAKLLNASNKYDIPALKNICEEYLSFALCEENSVDTLILADMNSADALKASALKYIAVNVKKSTDKVALLSITHPHLVLSIVQAIAAEKSD